MAGPTVYQTDWRMDRDVRTHLKPITSNNHTVIIKTKWEVCNYNHTVLIKEKTQSLQMTTIFDNHTVNQRKDRCSNPNTTMIKEKIRRCEPGICTWPNVLFCWYWCLFSLSPNSLPEGWRLFFCFFFAWLHGDSKQCQLRKSISITPNDQNSFDIWPPYMIFLIGLLKLIFCQAWIMNFCQKVSAKKTTHFPPFIWK